MQEITFLVLVYVLFTYNDERKYIIRLNLTWFESKGTVFAINMS